MKCEFPEDRLIDYLDGALDECTLAEVEAHLEECLECRQEVESLRDIKTRLDQLPVGAPPPTGTVRFEEMLRAYELARQTPGATPGEAVRGRWLLQAAAAVILIALGAIAGYGLKDEAAPIASRDDGLTRYILTVYEIREQTERIPRARMRAAGERYRVWMKELTESGQLLDVALLRTEGAANLTEVEGQAEVTALELPVDREVMTYYWLIQAESRDDAVRIARGCPMLAIGARVELREIEGYELPST